MRGTLAVAPVEAAFLLKSRGVGSLGSFDAVCNEWLAKQISEETNPRRRELLQKGLGHATLEFLRIVYMRGNIVDFRFIVAVY